MTPAQAAEYQKNQAGGIGQELAELITKVVYVFTVGLGSSIAFVASYFFNFSVYISLNSTAYAVDFLTKGWTEVRNIANMGFIFILIYIAVTITLKAETGKTKEMLVRVIAIALLINFSFFFVRLVIDGGNILAVNFYNATTNQTVGDSLKKADLTTSVTSTVVGSLSGASAGAKDLTAGIMGAIQVTNILNEKSFKAFADSNSQSGDGGFFAMLIALSFIYICVGVIFGLLAAMFFTIGIKFITRVVVLWVVIIAAPLALLMYAVPNSKAQGYFKEWLHALIAYSVYPAVFLFLYIIIINFTVGISGGDSLIGSVFTDVNNSNAIGLPYILGLIANISIKFGFVMILLYLAMQVSNAVSKMGGSLAQNITSRPDKWGASLAGFSRRLSTAGPRIGANFAYRNTVGRGANVLDKTLRTSSWANSKALNNALLGHPVAAVREKFLQPTAKVGLGGGLSRVDYDKQYGEKEKERKTNIQDIENRKNVAQLGALKSQLDAIRAKEASGVGLSPDESDTKAQGIQLRSNIKKFGKRELETLKSGDIKAIIGELNESQMKTIKESEKFAEQDRRDFDTAWHKESGAAPLKKTQQQIDLLKDIRKELNHLSLSKIDIHTTAGNTLNSASIKEMREDIEDQMADARTKARNSGFAPTDRKKAEKDAIKLQKGINELKTLEERLKEVPRGLQDKSSGSKTEAGEVVVK